MNIDLTGKVTLVTGGAGKLGAYICRTLARCGADVAIHYHSSKPKADALCEEIKQMGRRAIAVKADVTDLVSVQNMQREVVDALGNPDIIVNNAVIQYEWKTLLEQDLADFDSQYRGCITHNVLMCKTFVPAMIEKKWGRVIAINSDASLTCHPYSSAYVAAKGGITTMLQVLAKEIGKHNITVNQVYPGWMISDGDRALSAEEQETAYRNNPYAQMVPLGHRGDDKEVSYAVAFLASNYASFITQAFIPVTGGGATLPPHMRP